MNDSRAVEQLAARLDEVLPPGSTGIFEASDDLPEIKAAVRIARAPRPALSSASRRQIESRMRAKANLVFGTPVPSGGLRLVRWAAACLLIVLLVAVLLVAYAGEPDTRLRPTNHQTYVVRVPSSPHTSVIIPQDAILPPSPLTEMGGGSTSLFVSPGG